MSSFIYSPFADPIKWPQICAVCGKPTDLKIESSITDISDSGITWYKIRKQTLPYPICSKHRIPCYILDLPQRNSFVWWFLAILPILIITLIRKASQFAFQVPLNTTFTVWFILFLYTVVFLFLFAGKYLLPVRLSKADYQRIKVTIRNKRFLAEVFNLNSDTIGRTN